VTLTNLVDACDDLPRTSAGAGDIVIEQGQVPGPVYVLVEGAVTIERNGVAMARVTMPGSIFGEMSTLLQCPATATVRADVASTFVVAHDGEAFLTSRPDVTMAMARALATRLDEVSGYLTEIKRQFTGQAGHLGMLDDILSTLLNHQTPKVRPGSVRMPETDY